MTSAKKILSATALTFFLLAGAASAQTATDTTDTLDATVGTPNTGAGGSASENMLLMGISAAAALGGAAFLLSRRQTV
jgi:hypothetical protein